MSLPQNPFANQMRFCGAANAVDYWRLVLLMVRRDVGRVPGTMRLLQWLDAMAANAAGRV